MRSRVTVLLALLLVIQCSNASDSLPWKSEARRSCQWDEHINNLIHATREKRQSNPSGCGVRSQFHGNCELSTAETLQYDTLGRRASGLLADVQNQGCCGSCWAFAAAHTLSDHLSISAGRKLDLSSAQDLAECVYRSRTGCCGGYGHEAAEHFRNTGTVSDRCKPYTLEEDTTDCRDTQQKNTPLACQQMCAANSGLSYNPSSMRTTTIQYTGWLDSTNPVSRDAQIINALETYGPVWAYVDVDSLFSPYTCGVHRYQSFYVNINGFVRVNRILSPHAVVIVDYGTTDTGCDFWVVKNSWGANWGEGGYMRIQRRELCIGLYNVYFVPINVQANRIDDGTTSNMSAFQTCAPVEVTNPSEDMLIESAAAIGLEELVNRNVAKCPNGPVASNLTLNSIVDGMAQSVAGTMIFITLRANVHGCEQDAVASITLELFLDLDGAFSLTDYSYNTAGGGGASFTNPSNVIIWLVAITLAICCY